MYIRVLKQNVFLACQKSLRTCSVLLPLEMAVSRLKFRFFVSKNDMGFREDLAPCKQSFNKYYINVKFLSPNLSLTCQKYSQLPPSPPFLKNIITINQFKQTYIFSWRIQFCIEKSE